MSARRRRGEHEEEAGHDERWTVSYMDMVTVMMCLFIVLFAISSVDAQKFAELRDSLAAGSGDGSTVTVVDGSSGVLDGSSGVLDAGGSADTAPPDTAPPDTAPTDDDGTQATAARAEAADLTELRDRMRTDLEATGLADEVRFSITERGLVAGLVTENTFFSPASAAMPATTLEVIDTIADILAPLGHDILLEGHANILPYTEPYETNWELSADRATKVLRRMVEHAGIEPTRVRAVGYGDAYPAAEGPDALDLNRRVDVVVLSDQPEQVRRLLPELTHGTEGA